MVQYKCWEEANKAASDLDEEYKAKVGEWIWQHDKTG